MFEAQAICSPKWLQSPIPTRNCIPKPRIGFLTGISNPNVLICQTPIHFSPQENIKSRTPFAVNASSTSVGRAEYIEEPATKERFQTSLSLPGCSSSLTLLGTGYREKVFAIIGVKVYAAGLYANLSILNSLNAWKGRSTAEIQEDSSLFSSIFLSPSEKSLQIVLVRDVDGKTFWDALNDAISPRIKSPTPVDESALSTFRSIFQGQPLKKGTFIFLTWPDPSKMLVCISSDGLPSGVDTEIESENVAFALFDVFFGDTPVSPSLKASVLNGLGSILKS
ncbi:fatty-acid-binding protein 3-like [Pyrus ussuriensis x Pyrus communis]|uniref:Chalcone-flavonone isomerase family protein n=2 Tax=Pyrus TaxID=3766 RepID=A0A5N5H9E0_9ROSA|nr:fatty-acid-binding protein 3-like [Pyrus ussuriensis x Pyrus communis]